jgi:hypothetical protein
MAALPALRRTALVKAWRDAAWPVLAGAVAAAGLLGVWQLTSVLAVVLMIAGLWVLLGVTLYGVASESGLRAGAAVRIGLISAVSTVALLGLVTVLPVGGWIVALLVGTTAPAVIDWTAPHVRRAAAAVRRLQATSAVEPDQVAVDRAFERIVIDIDNDNDTA